MKLRNKRTGRIGNLVLNINPNRESFAVLSTENGDTLCGNAVIGDYDTLAELNEDWEDYEDSKAYYIERAGTIEEFDPSKDICLTEMIKEIGNYFETKEEAERAVDKLKAWKRLKDKGFKFQNYAIFQSILDECETTHIDVTINASEVDAKEDLDLLFGGEE